ncbi:MAG: hypothetical protein UR69_C0002G0254 [Candidatus Moranbacteria bacterium GW2011_GWE2_35_2-]|nr:MAG: hypothetical protein UR69_C0002G0254 [Candidatus Moranbacteria bacterium GW2011_GWE2_35_2-]KKQ06851.1 MAG: hypothetical protein US15_C0002G0004 [Candidatus Moranbacteria bacterium GW2011_GWF1_36_4]KKQ22400.1 MAG: hypothetical protein US37_C0002G0025 [Candidatus Moranbacteria bacterium GW2011_GWF2_37_11]KKQ29468.1 MAG: hypothetical protein US44_C0001G0060 [Candidatus Moranbacteria bacterium GW2011_GWD1_37_17]KKQ30664.1 MAG: hypothetical protein US47_C0002G0254 [Candidatus Moranbacteria b
MKKNIFNRKSNVYMIIIFSFVIAFGFFQSVLAQSYVPMEKLPGSPGAANLKDYVLAIYNFAIWTVGIAAFFMISIGGFWYFTAAGNTSKTAKAKEIIGDALLGVIVSMIAWLILYVINPDLVNVNLSSLGEGLRISQ